SQEMLNMAIEKRKNDSILYLCQDMRELDLYGTVAAVVSLCDSINYITEFEDLVTTFKLVNNYLDPGGIFVFDLKTIELYRSIGESVIAEDREDCSFMEKAIAGNLEIMKLAYTEDVMRMMTRIRRDWGLTYPEEE
ncbi:Methyltransferase, partial [human gut metagenome]